MYISDLLEAGVQDRTISLIHKWLENRLKSMIKPAFMPKETQRFVFELGYSAKGKATYKITILEGLDFIRSTSPKEHTDADELGFVFRELNDDDQLLILAWFDPFMEFEDNGEWRSFLIEHGIPKKHKEMTIEALLRLQDLLIDKGVVRMTENDILRGWAQIAEYLNMSVPSAVRMAKERKLPCSMVGGTIVTTKTRINAWLEDQIDANPYHKQRENKRMRR